VFTCGVPDKSVGVLEQRHAKQLFGSVWFLTEAIKNHKTVRFQSAGATY
jgi:hypothetical protein